MATTLTTLVSNTQLSDTDPATSAIAESTTGEKRMIGVALFTNTNTTTEDVTIWVLPNGVSPTAANYTVKRSIPAGKNWVSKELAGQVYEAGGKVYGASTTASKVNVYISGVLET